MSFQDNLVSIKADPNNEEVFFVKAKSLQNRALLVRFAKAKDQTSACSTTLVAIINNKKEGRHATQTVFNGDLVYVSLTLRNVDARDYHSLWNKLCTKAEHLLPTQAILAALTKKPDLQL